MAEDGRVEGHVLIVSCENTQLAGKQQGQAWTQAVLVLNHCPSQLLCLYGLENFPEGDTKALTVVTSGE